MRLNSLPSLKDLKIGNTETETRKMKREESSVLSPEEIILDLESENSAKKVIFKLLIISRCFICFPSPQKDAASEISIDNNGPEYNKDIEISSLEEHSTQTNIGFEGRNPEVGEPESNLCELQKKKKPSVKVLVNIVKPLVWLDMKTTLDHHHHHTNSI